MLDGTQSGCINHPGVEALARCKQCGRPVCGSCVVSGPTGNFCSQPCKEKHQAFMGKAQQLDGKARGGLFAKLRAMCAWIIILAAVCFALGVVATAVEIPVLSDIVFQIRGRIGL